MRVHDSQAYRKMDVTRERISRILELREIMLFSFQSGFNLVNVAVVCAIMRIFQVRNPRQINSPAHVLEAGDCLKLLSIYFDLFVEAAGVVINLVFSALISMP